MYLNHKIVAVPIVYNEEKKIRSEIGRFRSCDVLTHVDLLMFNDGSTDKTVEILNAEQVKYISHEKQSGVGASIRTVMSYAQKEGYDIIVIMAGNDKDRPDQILRLVDPIIKEGYDCIQGSRYLEGGSYGNMPIYRQIATRFVHPLLFSLLVRRRVTDTTNGFRAIRLSMLNDARLNLGQEWLDKYELEPYLLYKVITLGYRFKEVPVTKIYPDKAIGYTKMKPITGWWSILRPLVYLALGIKR